MSAPLLTVRQCAQRLQVSECWVRRHRHRLGVVRLGRGVRFDPAVVASLCTSPDSQFIVPAAERPLKPEGAEMLQRRYQRGSVKLFNGKRMKVWYGVWREDVIDLDGTLRRKQRNQRLGTIQELPTKWQAREALRLLIEQAKPVKAELTLATLIGRFEQTQAGAMKKSSADYTMRKLRGPLTLGFGSWEVRKIGRFDIESFLAREARRYSKNTLRGLRSSLSSVLGWAVGCGWLEKNPCLGVKLPRVCGGRRVQRRILTGEEVGRLAAGLEEPYATLVVLLYATGLRIGEACALRHEDLADGCLHVRRRLYEGEVDTVKTNQSNRRLPIPIALAERLRSLSSTGWIFQSRNGSPINPGNVMRRNLLPQAKRMGIELGGYHSFRHSFTVAQRKLGTHPKVLSGLLGHSGVQLAMNVYDHLDAEDFRRPLDQLLRSCYEVGDAA